MAKIALLRLVEVLSIESHYSSILMNIAEKSIHRFYYIRTQNLLPILESGLRGEITDVLGPKLLKVDEKIELLLVMLTICFNFFGTGFTQGGQLIYWKFVFTIHTWRRRRGRKWIICKKNLKFPENMKTKNRLPFNLSRIYISGEKLFTECMENQNAPKVKTLKKSISDQSGKKDYYCHYKNPKFGVKMGMEIRKLHWATSSEKKRWNEKLKKTKLSVKAEYEIRKPLTKDISSSFYWNTKEDLIKKSEFCSWKWLMYQRTV